MRKSLFFGAFLLAITAFSFGCGSSGSNPSPAPQVILDQNGNPLPSVDGTWASPCQHEGPAYQRAMYSIHGDQVSYVVQKYTDAQCTAGAVEVSHYDGHYQSIKAINNERGARQVTLKYDTCRGDCTAYGTANQTRVFKVDSGQFYAGSQNTDGSVKWDASVGFSKIGN